MARYYCDYCDARCSNNSASVRAQHNNGNLHRRNVSAFYSQFIGKDVQDKIDAIVAAFEAKVARGEVVPTYATFPRPIIVSRAEKAKDAGASGDADEPPVSKRPRGDAGVEEAAAPDSDAEGGIGGSVVQSGEAKGSSSPGVEEAIEKDAADREGSHRDRDDDDGNESDPSKKRRKLDADEHRDDLQSTAKSEPRSDAVPAVSTDNDAVSSLPSAIEDKNQTPAEDVAGQSTSEASPQGGDNADDGSDMDMDG